MIVKVKWEEVGKRFEGGKGGSRGRETGNQMRIRQGKAMTRQGRGDEGREGMKAGRNGCAE